MFAHMPERGALQILVLSTSTIFCDLSIEFMIVLSAFFLHVIPRLFYLVRLREKKCNNHASQQVNVSEL